MFSQIEDILKVFVDNNLWDYFSKHDVLLEEYFSENGFQLCVTKHGRYEVLQMPQRCELTRSYALDAIGSIVHEDSYFGFRNESIPDEYQRLSGYGVGRWISKEEREIRAKMVNKYWNQSKRKSQQILFKQEADIEIATRSVLFPILTFDTKKKGPIYYAYSKGYKVVYLDLEQSAMQSVPQFMQHIIERLLAYKKT